MRSSLAIALLVCVGGCNLAPPDERPPMPTDAAYRPEYVEGRTEGKPAPAIGWRDFFSDPRLEALIATAVLRNRDYRVAVAQIEEARGAYHIERADRLPSIDVNGEAIRSR